MEIRQLACWMSSLLVAGCAAIAGLDGEFSVGDGGTSSGSPAGVGAIGGSGGGGAHLGGSTATGGSGGASGGGGAAGGSSPVARSCQDILLLDSATANGGYVIDPDGEGGSGSFTVYCDMDTDEGGWTLVYSRTNAYFTPDHMVHQLPTIAGPMLNDNSTSWFTLPQADRWRWQVSVDGGATFRQLITSIPPEARATTHATVVDASIAQVFDNTTGAAGPFYYQTMTLIDACAYGCGSGTGTWFGIVNVTQGSGDQINPGIGGHSDSCDLDPFAQPADNYTWGGDDLELYWTDFKNVQGSGIGGTICNPTGPTDMYRMRIWVR